MVVGGSAVQPPPTPGLVHISVVPPAVPETVSVPLHVPPVGLMMAMVNVPEKEFVVVAPPTEPLLETVPPVVCHVPLTFAPLWVRLKLTGCEIWPPAAIVVNVIVPVHVPATLAGDGVTGDLEPPHATALRRNAQTHAYFSIATPSETT